jgi:hypothetical protein
MTEPARSAEVLPADAAAGPLRPAEGLRLLGEYQGSGFTEPRFLVRRGNGQVIQMSRLLYLVTAAIAEGGAADRGWEASRVAAPAAGGFGAKSPPTTSAAWSPASSAPSAWCGQVIRARSRLRRTAHRAPRPGRTCCSC